MSTDRVFHSKADRFLDQSEDKASDALFPAADAPKKKFQVTVRCGEESTSAVIEAATRRAALEEATHYHETLSVFFLPTQDRPRGAVIALVVEL
jgi:hypothetical protein